MANLGIAIAVSDYTGDASDLPPCRHDGVAIANVFKSSGRFDDILHIDSDTIGTNVKQRLADFAKVHKGKDIDEVFFYFTGHGEFVGDEFYYLLTDYQTKKRNQTSLENSELDGIIRSLSPRLFVKIVDACQSGVTYIKTTDDFRDYLKAADKNFDKLYFMFSSQAAQFSYQNDKISYFTESILKSIVNHPSDTIRYKDIISFVSDEFKERDFQTPLFVTQADFTEMFCDVTAALKERIKGYIQEVQDSIPAKADDGAESLTLIVRLKEDARRYCSKEEALDIVSSLSKIIERRPLPEDLAGIFLREVHSEQDIPPGSTAVGGWLDQGKDERKYFARPNKEWRTFKRTVFPDHYKTGFRTTQYGVELSNVFRQAARDYGDIEEKEIEEKKEIITGFSSTTDLPFQYIRIHLNPKLPNLAPEECYLIPLLSKTHLRLFWAFAHFEYVDWDKASRVGKLEWHTNEVPLRDARAIEKLIGKIDGGFLNFVEEPLRVRWSSEAEASMSLTKNEAASTESPEASAKSD